MRDAPCKNCTERKPLCHEFCGKYKAFRAEVDAARKKKDEYQDVRCYQKDVSRAWRRRNHES